MPYMRVKPFRDWTRLISHELVALQEGHTAMAPMLLSFLVRLVEGVGYQGVASD